LEIANLSHYIDWRLGMKRFIKISLLLSWMAIIFIFSHQTGAASSISSQRLIIILQFIGIDVNSVYGHLSQLVIRKLAHLFEYFILCLLFYNLFKDYLKHPMIYSVFFTFLYACTDEAHQLFVLNRSASTVDVIIDTLGGFLGIGAVYLIRKLKKVLIA